MPLFSVSREDFPLESSGSQVRPQTLPRPPPELASLVLLVLVPNASSTLLPVGSPALGCPFLVTHGGARLLSRGLQQRPRHHHAPDSV